MFLILSKFKELFFTFYNVLQTSEILYIFGNSLRRHWYGIAPEDGTIEDFLFAKHGHHLTSIIECSLVLMPYATLFPVVTTIFHSLRRLSLNDSRWTSNTILFLVRNTPNLHTLRLRPYGGFAQVFSTTSIHVNHLRNLELLLSQDSNELDSSLMVFPGLRCLRVVYYGNESAPLFDGRAWQNLLEHHLKDLRKMTLDFYDDDESCIGETFIKTFYQGEFWLEKQVTTETTLSQAVDLDQIVRRICFGKPWAFDIGR